MSGRGEAAASGRGGPGIRLHPSAPPVSSGPGPAPPRRGPPRTRPWAHIGGGRGRRGPRPPRRRAAAGALRRRSRPAPCRGRGLGPLLAGRGRGATPEPRARPRGRSGNGDRGYCWGGAGSSQPLPASPRARPAGGSPFSWGGSLLSPGRVQSRGASPFSRGLSPGGLWRSGRGPALLPRGLRGWLGSFPRGFGGGFGGSGGLWERRGSGLAAGGRKKSRQSFWMCWVTLGVLCLCGVFFFPPLFLSRAHITTASALVSCKLGILRASRPNLRNALILLLLLLLFALVNV